ncbi:four helix bundle protein [Flagellimonas nanhaiensis]|uniref:Four helix bundle protein n=1 Tax=Flagellimonas nanhaiensis TaxID=2292706 RepID=A0A371JR09_9FLAO|nr:four helix bundle protein [Allomuricauda nanhaiensis]RDY59937.1 four helix bundle protein [Allomuricauda nanhaiensis]
MANYKNYKVWEKSHQLVISIYGITRDFPKSELYNLTSQMNRASVSIPTNIAEGCGRETQKEFIRFLYFASGSAHELDYLLLLASELGYIESETSKNIISEIDEIKKMLAALINTIKISL